MGQLLFMKSKHLSYIFFIIAEVLFCTAVFLLPLPLQAQKKKLKASVFQDAIVKEANAEKITIRWQKSPFVWYYVLEIKDSRGRILLARKTKETVYVFDREIPGVYFYRLSLFNRLGVREVQSNWKKFEIVKIYIPEVDSLDPTQLYPRTAYELTLKGKNFTEANTVAAIQVFKDKKKIKEKGEPVRIVVEERLGNPIPLRSKVKSSDNMKLIIPPNQLGLGNYRLSFFFHERPLYLSDKPLFSVEPKKFISRFYFMPSFFYVQKNTPPKQLFNLGFGIDIRWGTRFFNNQMEVGIAGGFYFLTSNKRYIQVASLLPLGIYIGYNGKIPLKNKKIQFSIMPYLDIGYDLYVMKYKSDFQSVFKKNYSGVAKTNLGLMFLVEKNNLLFSLGTAAAFGLSKKEVFFTGIFINIGVGVRMSVVLRKKKE